MVLCCQLVTQLIEKILSLTSNVLSHTREFYLRLGSIGATFDFTRKLVLQTLQSLFLLSKVLGMLNSLAITQYRKVLQAKIHSYLTLTMGVSNRVYFTLD